MEPILQSLNHLPTCPARPLKNHINQLLDNPQTLEYQRYQRLKEAIEEGGETLMTLVETVQNNVKFTATVNRTKKITEPAERLAALQEFESKSLDITNRQWLYIQIGFAHEALDEKEAAVAAYEKAISEGGSDHKDSANTKYASQQIERLEG